MAQILAAALTAVFVVASPFASARKPPVRQRHDCLWSQRLTPAAAAPRPPATSIPYGGGAALAVGTFGLIARSRRR